MLKMRLVATVLFAVVSGCSGSPGATNPTSPVLGILTVRVIGLDSAFLVQGGQVALVKTGVSSQAEIARAIPPDGRLDLSLPVGTYSVFYRPPNKYTSIAPAPAAANVVTITPGSTASLQFEVAPFHGTIWLDFDLVAGSAPPTGGSVSVRRADGPNGSDTSLVLSSLQRNLYDEDGVDVAPGTYHVTYRPPDDYAVLAGASYFVSANVGTASVVVRPGDSVGFLFEIAGK